MITYLTNELVPRSLRAAGLDNCIVDAMTDREFNVARMALVAALSEGASCGVVRVTDPATDRPPSLSSFLCLGTPDGADEKVLAFSLTHLASEGLFPILGLLFAAFSGELSVSSLESVATAGRALWTSAALLKSPDDDNALEALRAFGKSKLALAGTGQAYPTNANIAAQCSLTPNVLANALARLEALKIIKSMQGGSVVGRYEDADNAWAACL